MKIKNIRNIFILLVILLASFFVYTRLRPKITPSVKIGEAVFKVELARTNEERAKGLAGHRPLQDDEGMLFEFDKGTAGAFWMKGMTFPIDIIWITDNKISYIVENTPIPKPGQGDVDLPVYNPPKPADWVLEINSGLVKKNKIKLDDPVKIQL